MAGIETTTLHIARYGKFEITRPSRHKPFIISTTIKTRILAVLSTGHSPTILGTMHPVGAHHIDVAITVLSLHCYIQSEYNRFSPVLTSNSSFSISKNTGTNSLHFRFSKTVWKNMNIGSLQKQNRGMSHDLKLLR